MLLIYIERFSKVKNKEKLVAVTIKDIAKIAGVSVSAVSIALNNKPGVSKDTRFRIIAVAEKLQYEPNILAKGLITRKSYIIGVLISDISNPFFTKVKLI